jgi:hypothetical protein
MKTIIAMILSVALYGCAATAPVVTSEQVKVPVQVVCTVQHPTKPKNLLSNLKPSDSILTKGNAVLAELKLYQIYSAELDAALTTCTTAQSDVKTAQ